MVGSGVEARSFKWQYVMQPTRILLNSTFDIQLNLKTKNYENKSVFLKPDCGRQLK